MGDSLRELVLCNLCGQDDTQVIATRDRYGLETRVVQCRQCGLRYQNPRMTAEGYAEFYRTGYRPLLEAYMGKPYPLAQIENDQWRYAADLSRVVAKWMEPLAGGTLVDIGGSTGIVGRLFRARWGFDVTVIDPSPDELARARDCRTICGSAETVEMPGVDVALLCRTIDHLLDPLGVLRRVRARVLVVDAMQVDGWLEPYRYKVDHPYAFTTDTLSRLLKAAGWEPRGMWKRRGEQYVGLICKPAGATT